MACISLVFQAIVTEEVVSPANVDDNVVFQSNVDDDVNSQANVTDNDEIVVVHYSDAHVGDGEYLDAQGRNSTQRYSILLDALETIDFDFAVDTGDSVNGANGSQSEVWDTFESLISGRNFSNYYVMGNHDWSHIYGRQRWLDITGLDYIYKLDYENCRFLFVAPEEWGEIGNSEPRFSSSNKVLVEAHLDTELPVFLFTHAGFDYWNQTSYVETVSSKITFLGYGHDHNYVEPTQDGYISSRVPSIRTGSFEAHSEIYFNKYTISDNTVLIEVINAETLDVYYSTEFTF